MKKTQTIKCFTVPNLCNIEWKGKQIHQLPRETVKDSFKKGLADTGVVVFAEIDSLEVQTFQ